MTKGIDLELRLFADNCVCYREIKNSLDTVKLQEDIDLLGVGQGVGYEVNADKETVQADHCFLYLRGNGPR